MNSKSVFIFTWLFILFFLFALVLSTTGEYTRIDRPNNKIIIGEALNNARNVITKRELPILLANGRVTDDRGASYPYLQEIQLNGNARVYYSQSDNDLMDPAVHIEMEPVSDSPTYTTRVFFSKSIPVSSTDVIFNPITLFGKDYAIGSGSDYNTLVLYGEYGTYVINEGEETTVTLGGTEYTVGVSGVNDAETAVITVNGVSESMNQGNTKKISGLDVYLSAVYYYPKEGEISQAKISLGSSKITLENGNEVLLDTNNYVDETLVTITGSASTNKISSFTVSTPAQDSDLDHILIGEAYTDPVWGSFKLEFSGTTPVLEDPNNHMISITGSTDTAFIKFTDYSDNEKTINFAYDNNTASGTVSLWLMDSNSFKIHIKEGDQVFYKDYVVVNNGDDTHLLRLSNVPAGSIKTTDVLRFTDQFSGTTYEHTFTSSEIGANSCIGGAGANVIMAIGSQHYYVMVCNASTKTDSYVLITWNDVSSFSNDTGASYGIPGYMTFLPGIKAKNWEYVHFVNSYTTFINGDVVILPGYGDTSYAHTVDSSTSKTFKVGQIDYTYDHIKGTIVPTQLKDYAVGIMILEEERSDNTRHAIYTGITETVIPVTTTTTTTTPVNRTCTDSDGGLDYYTKGEVTVCTYYDWGGGCSGTVDRCDGNVLIEGYCEGTDSKSVQYTCPYGCEDGACISEIPTTTTTSTTTTTTIPNITTTTGPRAGGGPGGGAIGLTLKVAQPTFSDTTNTRDGYSGGVEYTAWGSNSYISSAMDAYGTLVIYNSYDQAGVTIVHPKQQLYTDIFISATEPPVVTTITTTISTTTTTIRIRGGGRAGKKSIAEFALAPIAIAVVVILIVFGVLKFFAKKI